MLSSVFSETGHQHAEQQRYEVLKYYIPNGFGDLRPSYFGTWTLLVRHCTKSTADCYAELLRSRRPRLHQKQLRADSGGEFRRGSIKGLYKAYKGII